MNDPKQPRHEAEALGLSQEEDWWKGWRLDEPADSVLPSLDAYASARGTGATEDWWAGWHAALLREE